MPLYTTQADILVWCEMTIEKADSSSLKTAAEHLLNEYKQQYEQLVQSDACIKALTESQKLLTDEVQHLKSQQKTLLKRLQGLRKRLRPYSECAPWVIQTLDKILGQPKKGS